MKNVNQKRETICPICKKEFWYLPPHLRHQHSLNQLAVALWIVLRGKKDATE
jgi:hypothetical protein